MRLNIETQRDNRGEEKRKIKIFYTFLWTNCILWNSGHCLQLAEDSKYNFEVVNMGTQNKKSVPSMEHKNAGRDFFLLIY
jgi:hypothetical protein